MGLVHNAAVVNGDSAIVTPLLVNSGIFVAMRRRKNGHFVMDVSAIKDFVYRMYLVI